VANYQNSQDLVNAVLSVSGELTDGTSGYQADALTYLNLAYKGVLTGGNIYGVDVADPWSWAISRRPIILTLQPIINTVSVTVTQESNTITFGSAPQDVYGNNISVLNWWISSINNRDEWFQIVQHTSGSTTAYIDMPYTEATASATTCNLTQLDYDLVDNSVVVTQYNNTIDFVEGSGSAKVATLTQGIYTPSAFATLVNNALHAAGSLTYSGSYNSVTRLFTWAASGTFSLLNASGSNAMVSASELMGLDCLDYVNAASYNASYPLNAINRLTSPMLLYRKPTTPWRNPKAEGKIYEVSFNTFVREYPLTMLYAGTPDKFCVVRTSPNGTVTIRLNAYMYQLPTRLEIGYIPKYRALQANATSIPILPEEHRKYLVDAAAAMIMHDKSDSKRTEREALAKAGLQALQHSERKQRSLAGTNYGKLVPRYGMTQKRWWWQIT
jgi:hypothetical protein